MGERIKRLREAKGLTQEELGRRCGVSKSAVSQWENGDTQNLRLTSLLKLLDVLGTDLRYLVYGADRAPHSPSSPSGARRSGTG